LAVFGGTSARTSDVNRPLNGAGPGRSVPVTLKSLTSQRIKRRPSLTYIGSSATVPRRGEKSPWLALFVLR
jgi:hypothetical protein